MTPLLELCIDTPAGIAAAVDNGVDRIELCSALALGGLTPSAALVAAAVASGIPVMAMIRPQPGGFDYDAASLRLMADEIDRMAALGVAGIVFGVMRAAALDVPAMEGLMAQVRSSARKRRAPLKTSLHRAIDLCADPVLALDQAVALGFDHVLSSGAAPTAIEGVAMLAALQRRAQGRCQIIAAAGIAADNVTALIAATGVAAVHASCRARPAGDPALAAFGFGDNNAIDPHRLAALRQAIPGIR